MNIALRDHYAGIAFDRFLEAHIKGTIDDLDLQVCVSESWRYANAMMSERERHFSDAGPCAALPDSFSDKHYSP